MQYIVAGHNITVYHTCILHSVINVFCTLVQKRCYVIDAKDSEIQYFKVHINNSLQLLAAKVQFFFDICKDFGENRLRKRILSEKMLFCGFKMGGERGNNEATESAIELVGCCAEELGVGAGYVLVSGFAVQDVTVLPIGETIRIGHLHFAETHGFRERADGAFAALGKRSGVRVLDSISVRATVAGAHDDAFFT